MGRARWAGGVNCFLFLAPLCALGLSLSGLGLSAAAQANTVAGELSGEFTVSAQGAASYRIPIAVPPGVAGMAPQLALAYNSQGGNGLLGVGWSLEGLSSISRCPASLVTDGHVRGVKYDSGDRFCLDGQNLISANGLYATAGAEYRTERENFSRVRSYGAAGGNTANGPAYFIVQTKAGLTMEYGKTEDARIQAQGKSVVRAWAVNAMVDAKGNRIEFKYAEDTAAGTHRLSCHHHM